jgi:hypothetical protein
LPSRPGKRGVGHRHERWDGERWTRRCPRAPVISGRIYRSVSGHDAHRRTALKRTAKACGPDASAVGVKSRGGFESPTGRKKPYSRGDGVKQARSPGRARHRPLKPLRRESRIASAGPVCSCACFCTILHTRPRVQRASGFPCALFFVEGKEFSLQTSGGSRRGNAKVCHAVIARSPCDEAIHLSACCAMDCFASARNDG